MKFKRAPEIKTAEEFISGAGTVVRTEPAAVALVPEARAIPATVASYPWEGKRSDKQTELFNLRLTEVELEKLRFIAAHTPDSMQVFARKVLLPAIDAKIVELTR
jgi:hypothetical protein